MIYSYDFSNQVRDVTPILELVNQNNPKLLSYVGIGQPVVSRTVEWVDGLLTGKKTTGTASDLVITADPIGLGVGMTMRPEDSSDWFTIASIAGSAITVTKGVSGFSAPPTGSTVYNVYSAPVVEGTNSGEESFWQGNIYTNNTQIFRRDAKVTGTGLSINTYDNSNSIDQQVLNAMELIQIDLNNALWHGIKKVGSTAVPGRMGGIYEICTENIVDAQTSALTLDMVNSLSESLVKNGCEPKVLIANRKQARKISAIMKDYIKLDQTDSVRGTYVTKFLTAFGNVLNIIYDDTCPPRDIWLGDLSKIEICPMENRAFEDKDSTDAGFDGIKRTILGEYTVKIHNATEAFGHIKNLSI